MQRIRLILQIEVETVWSVPSVVAGGPRKFAG